MLTPGHRPARARLRRAADPEAPAKRVLLLHGLGGSPLTWDAFAERAGPVMELWDAELPWAAMCDSVGWASGPDPVRIVTELLEARPYDAVVAHSYAANLLAEALADGRAAPPAAVLICPFYRADPHDFDWETIAYYLGDFHRVFEEALEVGEMRRYRENHRRWMARRLRDRAGPYGWTRWFEAYLRSPFLTLDRVRTPLLVLSGDRDIAARAGDGRALAARVPGARFELLEDCGHFPMLERPSHVTRAVGDFLAAAPTRLAGLEMS